MQHDPIDYPDPDAFKPERWLKDDGQFNHDVKDPIVAFGFGRRSVFLICSRFSQLKTYYPLSICPGRFFSDNTLFAVISTFLHVFDIVPALDKAGQPIPVEGKFHDAGGFL